MKGLLSALLLITAVRAISAQSCTESVLIQLFDRKTTLSINYLDAKDFVARADKASLPIRSSTQEFNNRILILLEVTGAADDPKVAQVIARSAEIAAQAPPGKPIAFGIFADRVVLMPGFISNVELRKQGIDAVLQQATTLGKRRALYDALHDGFLLFGPHQPGDTIIVVSDGADNQSKHNAEDLEKEFVPGGPRILVAFRPQKQVATSFRQISWDEFGKVKTLSWETGGGYTSFENPEVIGFASSGYLLNIEVPSDLKNGRGWKLELQGDAAKLYKDPLFMRPWTLAPCPPK